MNSDPLVNLLRIGLLDQVPISAELQQKMLTAAQSRLDDALRADNSMETRFDCAYPDRAISNSHPSVSQLAVAYGLDSKGYPAGSESPSVFHPNLSCSHYRALMRVTGKIL